MSQIIKFKLNFINKLDHSPGFSLLELIVVIAIISALVRTFIVTYPEYLAKTQIANTIQSLQIYRKKIEIFYVEHNTENNDGFNSLSNISQISNDNTFNNSNNILSKIELSKTATNIITLTATFNNNASSEIQGKSISLNISVNQQGIFSSLCNSDNINNILLPLECRS